MSVSRPPKKKKTSFNRAALCGSEVEHVERYVAKTRPRCTHCGATLFAHEPPGMCCKGGRAWPVLKDHVNKEVPDWYLTVIEDDPAKFTADAAHYNTALALSSTVLHQVNFSTPGEPVVKIRGQISHIVNSLLPSKTAEYDDKQGSFINVYYACGNNADEELKIRMERAKSTTRHADVLRRLQEGLKRSNKLIQLCVPPACTHMFGVQGFASNRQLTPASCCTCRYRVARNVAEQTGTTDVSLLLYGSNEAPTPTGSHPGQFAAPSGFGDNEVGAIVPHMDSGGLPPQTLAISTSGERTFVPKDSKISDALAYPLFHVTGETTWHKNMTFESNKGPKRLTALDYYRAAFLDHEQPNGAGRQPNLPLDIGGYLLQKYAIDTWVTKIEIPRLNHHEHRSKLMHTGARNMVEKLQQQGESLEDHLQPVKLSHTYQGSDSYYVQTFRDAIALCTVYGKPHLFITITANPNMDEVTTRLRPHQTPRHRPDLIARASRGRLLDLISKIKNDEIFGEISALVYTIEYQNRGESAR